MKHTKPTQHQSPLQACPSGTAGRRDLGVIKNPQHLAFIRHYLKCRNQAEAYRKAYKCTEKAAESNGSRLFNRPEIQAAIRQKQAVIEQKAMDIAESEITETLAEQYVSIHEKRMMLTGIMRRKCKVNRFFKMKDEIQVVEDDLPPSMLLRAIDMDTRLENGWYDRKPIPELKGEKKLKKEEPLPMPLERYIYLGKKPFAPEDPVLTDDELAALWQMSLTHDNILAPAPDVPDKFIGKMKIEKSPRTGRWVVAYAAPGVLEAMENDERNLSKPIKIPALGIDPERFADMIKNSEILRRTYNREIGIALYSGMEADEETKNTETMEPVEKQPTPEAPPGALPVADATEQLSEYPYITDAVPAVKPASAAAFSRQNRQSSQARSIFAPATSNHYAPTIPASLKPPASTEYRPVKEIWEEYMRAWQNTPSQRNNKSYNEVKAMYFAKDEPAKKRKLVELKSLWEFHPDNPQFMRKKIA